MIGDVLTVAWKEWRELFQLGGSHRGGRFSLVILIGVFGVFLPLQSGAEWVQSPATVFYWGWVPLMLVGSAVADSFAGERERHTLETLLASRLPDRAILLGKMLAAVAYGWGLVMVMLRAEPRHREPRRAHRRACSCSRGGSPSGRRCWRCWAQGWRQPPACWCRFGPRPCARPPRR